MTSFNIATAPRRDSAHWQQGSITWNEILLWMLEPGDRKEAGNYLLGTLRPTTVTHPGRDTPCTDLHRRKEAVVSRDALMLDSDTPGPDFPARIERLGVQALIHTTFSSTPDAPRYRVLIPLERPATPEEYTATAREVIEEVGADSFDMGSVEPERYMFRPAAEVPENFWYAVYQGAPRAVVSNSLAADPFAALEASPAGKRDPFTLPGAVGAFNRVYDDFEELVETFSLPYECEGADRWRYAGTVSPPGVAELSAGVWWSSHGTDPATGHAQTAFDLMRIHRYGHLDADAPPEASITDLPSYTAAVEYAEQDPAVRADLVEREFGADSPQAQLGYDPDSIHDADLAQQLASRGLEGQFLYSVGRGWHEWDGTRWRPCNELALWGPVVQALRGLIQEWFTTSRSAKDISALKQCLASPRVKRLIEMMRSILHVPAERLDAHPHLLNVGNGTVDLRTGELAPHSREDYLTRYTPTPYVPGATHPDWDTALTTMRPDTVPWMQLRCGQAATGYRTPDDVMPVLQGGGANGKTTFTGGLSAALGEHAVFLSERTVFSSSNDHPTELMTLQGARFALLEETPEGQALNVKRLKSLVGTPTITARRMRQDDETFVTTHSLFLTTNYHLRITETDTGTWRRLALVAFPYTYSNTLPGEDVRTPDPGLRKRIEDSPTGQHSAILSWLVEGAQKWFEAGQVLPEMPPSVRQDTNAWRSEADPLYLYLEERITFDPGSAIPTADLYEDFSNWLEAMGKPAWAENTFSGRFATHESVRAHGTEKKRQRVPSGTFTLSRLDDLAPLPDDRIRIWTGVRFTP